MTNTVKLLASRGTIDEGSATALLGRLGSARTLSDLRRTAIQIGRVEAGIVSYPAAGTRSATAPDFDRDVPARRTENAGATHAVDAASLRRHEVLELSQTAVSVIAIATQLGLDASTCAAVEQQLARVNDLLAHGGASAEIAIHTTHQLVEALDLRSVPVSMPSRPVSSPSTPSSTSSTAPA